MCVFFTYINIYIDLTSHQNVHKQYFSLLGFVLIELTYPSPRLLVISGIGKMFDVKLQEQQFWNTEV